MKKKSLLLCVFLIVVSLLLSTTVCAFAEDIQKEKEYNPLDLVVVVDSSGSMKTSDKNRTALDAVRMLVNMMPAEDSRVGIVSFNKTPTALTKNDKGKPGLVSLEQFSGVETIRDAVSGINYKGGTGIGNAVKQATDMLNAESSDAHTKAIILFTDGMNDLDNDRIALAKCDDNEAAAIQWAKNHGCVIYCVGYDYKTSSGISSMGKNGEGLKKLQNISDSTGGKFQKITNISQIEQLLIDFLADTCDLIYKHVDTIPGDGGFHECKIEVSPSVVEADIRIAGGDKNAVANGKIHLFDPDDKEIKLQNTNSVRFDKDATAASIKVIMPKPGEWLLTVEDIKGEDIHVGLLEHFKMNLTSQLSFPNGNPEGVAYNGDTVGIKAWLSYDGNALDNDEVYNAVTSATATLVSRKDPKDKKKIKLQRDGKSFKGDFVIPEDCFYDIKVRLEWNTVYREDTLTVASSNKPLELAKKIEDIDVKKKKPFEVKDIYQYVKDEENDAIDASITSYSNPGVADVTIKGDSLEIVGKKWSSTLVTVQYKDEQGNTVDVTFKVKVHDPIALAGIISTLVLIALLILLFIYSAFRSRIHLFGKAHICVIADGEIDAAGNFTRDSNGFCYASADAAEATVTVTKIPPIGDTQDVFRSSTPTGEGIFGNPQSGQTSGLFGNPQSGQTSGLFGNPQSGQISGLFGNQQSEQGSGVFGNTPKEPEKTTTMFGTEDSNSELEISKRYKGQFSIGGKRTKKTTVEALLEGCYTDYLDYMKRQSQNNTQLVIPKEMETRLSSIRGVTSKMYLLGTIGGKGGAVLKVDKKLLKAPLITMKTPRLLKNRATLPYYEKGVVELDFNVVTENAVDVKKGIRICVKIERN